MKSTSDPLICLLKILFFFCLYFAWLLTCHTDPFLTVQFPLPYPYLHTNFLYFELQNCGSLVSSSTPCVSLHFPYSFLCNIFFFISKYLTGFHLLRDLSLIMNFLFNPRPHINTYPFLCILLYLICFFYDDKTVRFKCLHVCPSPNWRLTFWDKIVFCWSSGPQDVANSNSSVSLLNCIRASYQIGRPSWVSTAIERTWMLLTMPHLVR